MFSSSAAKRPLRARPLISLLLSGRIREPIDAVIMASTPLHIREKIKLCHHLTFDAVKHIKNEVPHECEV